MKIKKKKEIYFDCFSNLIINTWESFYNNVFKTLIERIKLNMNNKEIVHSKLKFKIMDLLDNKVINYK